MYEYNFYMSTIFILNKLQTSYSYKSTYTKNNYTYMSIIFILNLITYMSIIFIF